MKESISEVLFHQPARYFGREFVGEVSWRDFHIDCVSVPDCISDEEEWAIGYRFLPFGDMTFSITFERWKPIHGELAD
ncbi:MAG: hypothetical protein IPM63_16180 [Acidobacteriota bacterium]|nr:MAG: hypothetical protein IPM63_16180 [Acidobacteriota bacterium]